LGKGEAEKRKLSVAAHFELEHTAASGEVSLARSESCVVGGDVGGEA
jgi:hypothetical protein